MSEPKFYFHLTLGPVQGFVAQARRTRDFWAGSFLLSWLSSVAMVSVQKQGGRINFPIPDDHFMSTLKGEITEALPQQGSVPNRFKTLAVEVDLHFDPRQVVGDVRAAWLALCDHIWERDLAPALTNSENAGQLSITRKLWQRQLTHYWEINWCLVSEGNANNVLDRRKNWRSHTLPPEPGVKCMMMEGFQELSGLEYPDQKKLEQFWRQVRTKIKAGNTDLRPGECLSALGFVKRRFVRHFASYRFTLPSGQSISGWKLPPQVPSVAHIAAAPWFAAAMKRAGSDSAVSKAMDRFFDEAEKLVGFSETANPIQRVARAAADGGYHKEWAGLDGNVFHVSQLENSKLFGDAEDTATNAKATLNALSQLRQGAGLPEASSFYAVLTMDGDSLGSQMSDAAKQKAISHGLNNFTKGVQPIVQQHDGFLVYAGGDDVLALVCLDTALELALALRNYYSDCFAQQNETLEDGKQIITSLSGAIEYCHIKTPLTFVLADSHSLLDNVAKDQTGRDSLAVRVWKPGGLHLEWSQPWQYLTEQARHTDNLLSDVIKLFAGREQHSPFTNKFIYKAENVLKRLPETLLTNEQKEGSDLLRQMLQAELVHSGIDLGAIQQKQNKQQILDELLTPLLALATRHTRQTDHQGKFKELKRQIGFDENALKLVRFLTQESILQPVQSAGQKTGTEIHP
jgi:CRISPR-associated protein Cmr2